MVICVMLSGKTTLSNTFSLINKGLSFMSDRPLFIFMLFKETKISYRILRPPDGLPKDKFYIFFCGTLQNAVIARL